MARFICFPQQYKTYGYRGFKFILFFTEFQNPFNVEYYQEIGLSKTQFNNGATTLGDDIIWSKEAPRSAAYEYVTTLVDKDYPELYDYLINQESTLYAYAKSDNKYYRFGADNIFKINPIEDEYYKFYRGTTTEGSYVQLNIHHFPIYFDWVDSNVGFAFVDKHNNTIKASVPEYTSIYKPETNYRPQLQTFVNNLPIKIEDLEQGTLYNLYLMVHLSNGYWVEMIENEKYIFSIGTLLSIPPYNGSTIVWTKEYDDNNLLVPTLAWWSQTNIKRYKFYVDTDDVMFVFTYNSSGFSEVEFLKIPDIICSNYAGTTATINIVGLDSNDRVLTYVYSETILFAKDESALDLPNVVFDGDKILQTFDHNTLYIISRNGTDLLYSTEITIWEVLNGKCKEIERATFLYDDSPDIDYPKQLELTFEDGFIKGDCEIRLGFRYHNVIDGIVHYSPSYTYRTFITNKYLYDAHMVQTTDGLHIRFNNSGCSSVNVEIKRYRVNPNFADDLISTDKFTQTIDTKYGECEFTIPSSYFIVESQTYYLIYIGGKRVYMYDGTYKLVWSNIPKFLWTTCIDGNGGKVNTKDARLDATEWNSLISTIEKVYTSKGKTVPTMTRAVKWGTTSTHTNETLSASMYNEVASALRGLGSTYAYDVTQNDIIQAQHFNTLMNELNAIIT